MKVHYSNEAYTLYFTVICLRLTDVSEIGYYSVIRKSRTPLLRPLDAGMSTRESELEVHFSSSFIAPSINL